MRNAIKKSAIVAALFTCAAVSSFTQAATVYSTGFENPPFSLSNLSGQDGWVINAFGPGSDGTGVVQNTLVKSGTQAVTLTRSADRDNGWRKSVSITPTDPASRYVIVSYDARYAPGVSDQFGPFFGIDVLSGIGRLGMAGFDAKTNDFLIYDPTETSPGSGIPLGLQPLGSALVTPNTWYNILVSFDYTDQVYHVYLDGDPITPVGGIDFATTGTATTFGSVDLAALAAGGDAQSFAATGSASFDNFSITTSSVVPEPGMVSLIAGFCMIVGVRRVQR